MASEKQKFDEEQESSSKSRKKAYAELYTERHFNTHILDNEKAALVFFITSHNVTAEVPAFERLFKLTNGPLQIGIYYLNESAEDFPETRKRMKLGAKFPQLRFYKNNVVGEEKNTKSFEIYLSNKVEAIMEEIHEGIDHDVRETSEKILMNVAQSHALEEGKNVVFYFYDEGRVSLHLKALST